MKVELILTFYLNSDLRFHIREIETLNTLITAHDEGYTCRYLHVAVLSG